jgi:hypothetical protein
MTRKQEIYQEILRRALPHVRNVSTWPWWRRLPDRSVRYEAELVHDLWPSLFDPEFVDHDIWFLNFQARAYCERCSPQLSPLYAENVKQIKELFAIVPDGHREKLKWSGPQ